MTFDKRSIQPDDDAYEAVRGRLKALASADRGIGAPARVEQQVMDAWDAAHPGPARRRLPARAAARATAAAAVLVVTSTLTYLYPGRPATPDTPPPGMAAEAPSEPYEVEIGADPVAPVVSHAFNKKPVHAPHAAVNESPVVVLVGAPMVPGERMHVVRMRVARETLMSMGLRAIDGGETEAVDVEMLVGEDGVARGLRAAM